MTESAYSLYQRGNAFLSEGLYEQAADVLARARLLEPAKASIREALGRAYYGAGQHGRAGAEFDAACAIDPANDYAHFGLALCLERQGDRVSARGHARMAVAMCPDNDDYRRVLARLDPAPGGRPPAP
jgi:tetratricopeptide (TPR) repeat protein